MPTLSFRTEHGPVVIELFNNPFVELWTAHTKKIVQKYQYQARTMSWPYYYRHNNGVDSVITQLLDVVEQINQQNFLLPLPHVVYRSDLESLDINTQMILNRLHRFCVTATTFRDRWLPDTAQWPRIDWGHEKFDYLTNLLNQTIHSLEAYVETPRKKRLRKITQATEFVVGASKYTDVDIYHDDVDVVIPVDMQQYLSLDGADVWIKKDILGKDYFTGFIDHDDVSQSDIQPPPMFSGGFMIDFTGRQALYQDSEFNQWLGKPLSLRHGNYALGRVISGKEYARDCQTISDVTIA